MVRNARRAKGIYPDYPADPISDIRDMFIRSARKFADKAALQSKKDGRWIAITYRELRAEVELLAGGLAALGLEPSTGKLAVVGNNRPEWAAAYLAAACTGIVCVPIDRDLKEIEVYGILRNSEAQAVICDDSHTEMIAALRPKLERLASVVNMDGGNSSAGILGFDELRERGRERLAAGRNDFAERTVSADSLLSILYTSGSTGNPKGVMLTHGNVASNIVEAVKWVDLRGEDRFLSVLPMHHSYECTDGFLLALYIGATTSYAENIRRIAENLAETKSTAMLGVPLLWHAVYAKIRAGMEQKGIRKVAAAKALAALSERILGLNIRRLLFRKVHKKFGGCLRILISGGAAVDPEVAKGFRELGIAFLQGYGLTESSPIITVNRNKAFKDDAAGLPLESVEVRVAEDGEILARGPNIMTGYYKNPEATGAALKDGWLHTGDLGYIDSNGFLYIQGRKKSVIVTPAGKKIYPEEVEAEILKSPYISECLVRERTGDHAGEDVAIEAIVVPDIEQFKESELEGGIANPAVEKILRKEVKERCQALASFKRVGRITVRYEELEKTTTKKIKRYLYAAGKKSDGA